MKTHTRRLNSCRQAARIPSSVSVAFVAIGLYVLLSCTVAYASETTFTIPGTLYEGVDFTGVFGFTPQTSLNGQPFTLVYTFDDTKGQQAVQTTGGTPWESSITGTNAESPGTATLYINDHSLEFGAWPGRYPASVVESNAYRDVVAGQSGSNRAEETVSEYYTGVPDSGAESYVDALVAVQTGDPQMTTDYHWDSGFTYTLTAGDQLASRSSGFLIRDETGLSRLEFAYGAFTEDTITITGPSSAVPEPSVGMLTITGSLLFASGYYRRGAGG